MVNFIFTYFAIIFLKKEIKFTMQYLRRPHKTMHTASDYAFISNHCVICIISI